MFTNAPPELPGLIAASVWIASITECWPVLWSPVVTGRSRALMMPVVTVPCSPSGEPMATTFWPTFRSFDDPSAIGVRPETPWALTTAMSSAGSVPTTVNGTVRPSEKDTVACASPPGIPWPPGIPGPPGVS